MPKIKIPTKVVEWFRDQAIGIDKLEQFMELPNRVLPVFIVNPSTVRAEVSRKSGLTPWDEITPELESDETVNDSDKTISVPSGEEWKILEVYVEFTSTATVGNRIVGIYIRDSADDIIDRVGFNVNQAASVTYYYRYLAGVEITNGGSGIQNTPCLPNPCILPAGFDLRILDSAAVDAAADDMIIQMMVKKRSV